jgi:2,3-bisphosphoglycerate-dependent phosphoglycerate mutase
MQLYFIRHAQSENNALWYRTGSNQGRNEDPALTRVGWQQAEILAEYLARTDFNLKPNNRDFQNVAGFELTHLYTSLMVRAIATGSLLAEALHLPLVAWEDLHEVGGIWREQPESGMRVGQPGRGRAFFESRYPDLILPGSLDHQGWWNRPYEEPLQRADRARRFVRDLLDEHGGTEDRVAVVSHGGFYNEVMHALLDLPTRNGVSFTMNNTAITRVDFVGTRPEVVAYTNRVDHLPADLVT